MKKKNYSKKELLGKELSMEFSCQIAKILVSNNLSEPFKRKVEEFARYVTKDVVAEATKAVKFRKIEITITSPSMYEVSRVFKLFKGDGRYNNQTGAILKHRQLFKKISASLGRIYDSGFKEFTLEEFYVQELIGVEELSYRDLLDCWKKRKTTYLDNISRVMNYSNGNVLRIRLNLLTAMSAPDYTTFAKILRLMEDFFSEADRISSEQPLLTLPTTVFQNKKLKIGEIANLVHTDDLIGLLNQSTAQHNAVHYRPIRFSSSISTVGLVINAFTDNYTGFKVGFYRGYRIVTNFGQFEPKDDQQ